MPPGPGSAEMTAWSMPSRDEVVGDLQAAGTAAHHDDRRSDRREGSSRRTARLRVTALGSPSTCDGWRASSRRLTDWSMRNMTGGNMSRKARRSGPASCSAVTGTQRHDVGDRSAHRAAGRSRRRSRPCRAARCPGRRRAPLTSPSRMMKKPPPAKPWRRMRWPAGNDSSDMVWATASAAVARGRRRAQPGEGVEDLSFIHALSLPS